MRIPSTALRVIATGGALTATGCDDVTAGITVVGIAAATALAALLGTKRHRSQPAETLLGSRDDLFKKEPPGVPIGALSSTREEDFFVLNCPEINGVSATKYLRLTNPEQLMQKKQKYLLVKIGEEFEFRIGAFSHQEMATAASQKEDHEERELIVGAGFIWIHDQSGEIVINGKSQTFPTQLQAVHSEYFREHLFMASSPSGLEKVASCLREKIFRKRNGFQVKIDI